MTIPPPKGIGLTALTTGLSWVWLALGAMPAWRTNEEYQFGWFVPPLAAYFLVRRLVETAPRERDPWFTGASITLMGLAFFLVIPLEFLRLAPLSWTAIIWGQFFATAALTIAAFYLVGGPSYATATFVPLLFLATAVPIPTAIELPVTVGLSHWIAPVVADALRLAGIPVQTTGAVLHLPNCVLGIEAACSGVRGLQGGVMIALAAGELLSLTWPRRMFLLLLAPILATLLNVARSTYLGFVGAAAGADGIDAQHDTVALVAFVVLASLLLGAAWMLRTPHKERQMIYTRGPLPLKGGLRTGWIVALLIACCGAAAANIWYATGQGAEAGSPRLELRTDSPDITADPVPHAVESLLRYDQGGYASTKLPGGASANAYHFFWSASPSNVQQLYHRPEVCMPGAGWMQQGPPQPVTVDIGGTPLTWQVIDYKREGRRVKVAWLALLNGVPLELEMTGAGSLQSQVMGDLIRHRVTSPTYEVGSVVIPDTGTGDTDETLREAIRDFFEVLP